MSDPLEQERTDHYPAHLIGGPRVASDIDWIVLHSTESPANTADGTAAYFQSPSAKGSTQLVVDDNVTERCVGDLVIPAGAVGANTNGLHVEHCGYASWTRDEWLARIDTLKRSAFKVAAWCKAFSIPVVLLTAPDLAARKRGITTHNEVNKWYPSSGHTDPGPGFPLDLYLGYVNDFLNPPQEDQMTPEQADQLNKVYWYLRGRATALSEDPNVKGWAFRTGLKDGSNSAPSQTAPPNSP